MLQLLKVPVEPRKAKLEKYHVCAFTFLFFSIFCWLLLGTQGWKGYRLTQCGLSCVLRKKGVKTRCTWHHVGDAGIVIVLVCLRCSDEPRRPALRNPLPLLLWSSIITNSNKLQHFRVAASSLEKPCEPFVCFPVYIKTIPDNLIAQAQKPFTKLIPYNG